MKTKIIATIGPSSKDFKILKRMKAAGMSIGRINTKYAKKDEALALHKKLQELKCKTIIDVIPNGISDYLKKTDFDYLALSFTNTAEQIKEVREYFSPRNIKIIAKIETKKGTKNIDSIIKECDGMMVARGDLGENIPIEKLPIAQKSIIKKCNKSGKFVITATEMLLSMVNSKEPTRAEVSDVANAVLDGSDAVMLSEETAVGKYPVLTVKTMAKIVAQTEKYEKVLEKKIIT